MSFFARVSALFVGALLLSLPSGAQQAVQSDSFVDSVGVSIHLHYTETPYYLNFPLVKKSLINLGVRHTRDGLIDTTLQAYYDRHNELASYGIKGIYITTASQPASLFQSWPAHVSAAFEGYENANELDLVSGGLTTLKTSTPALYEAAKNGPYKNAFVVGPSLTQTASYGTLGNMSASLDYGNLHNYMGGRNPGTSGWGGSAYGSIPYSIQNEKIVAGTKPIFTTETGYTNQTTVANWVPEDVAAIYMPRVLLEQWNAGIKRTYLYELLSEGGEDFGLMRSDGTYKPAYYAVANLLNLLSDKGASFTPTNLAYTLSGGDSTLHKLLLQKRDGTYYLALWLEQSCYNPDAHTPIAVTPQDIKLTSPHSFASATSYQWDATGQVTTKKLDTSSSNFALTVSDKLQIIELSPTDTWALNLTITPSAGGTVTSNPTSSDWKFANNQSIVLTATPNIGFAFESFTGTVTQYGTTVAIPGGSTTSEIATFRCTYTPASASANVPNTAGSTTIGLVTGNGCPVATKSSSSWLSVATNGNSITLTTTANTAGARTGTATVGDSTIQVTQAASTATWKLNLNTTPSAGGTVAITPAATDNIYKAGTTVTLKAVANNGYSFSGFTGAFPSSNSTLSITPSNSATVVANFTCAYSPSATTATMAAEGGSNTLTYSSGSGCSAQPTTSASWLTASAANGKLTLTAAANSTAGVRTATASLGSSIITVTQPSSTTTWKLSLNNAPSAGGTITLSPAAPDNTYKVGTSVTLTAVANSGYVFTGYTGAVSSTSKSVTVSGKSTATVVGNFQCSFAPSTKSVTMAASANSSTVPYTTGTGCGVVPVSNASWLRASAVSGVLTLSATENTTTASRSATLTLGDATIAVTQPANGTVFAQLASNVSGSWVMVDGKPYVAGTNLRVTAGSAHTFSPAAAQNINGTVYLFNGWSAGISGNAAQTINVSSTTTYAEQLVVGNYLNAYGTTGGTVKYSKQGQTYGSMMYYPISDVVTLTAVPNAGCTFQQWTGAITSNAAVVSATMSSSKSAIAHFTCSK